MTATSGNPDEDRQTMLATPSYEHRNDHAELRLTLEGAPTLEYTHNAWRSRVAPQVRRWQPDSARIIWDTGVLVAVHVNGSRLKKDGSLGLTREGLTFRVDGHGMVKPIKSDDFRYPTEWMQKLIDIYAECPAHQPPVGDWKERRARETAGSTRTPATILLPRA
jgi:hypothetical protein